MSARQLACRFVPSSGTSFFHSLSPSKAAAVAVVIVTVVIVLPLGFVMTTTTTSSGIVHVFPVATAPTTTSAVVIVVAVVVIVLSGFSGSSGWRWFMNYSGGSEGGSLAVEDIVGRSAFQFFDFLFLVFLHEVVDVDARPVRVGMIRTRFPANGGREGG